MTTPTPLVVTGGTSTLTMHLLPHRKVHVLLNGGGLVAEDTIEGDILGVGLQLLVQLLESPNGWEGTKDWQSLEGELRLAATCDRTGHVVLEAGLGSPWSGHGWAARVFLNLELGQLAVLRLRFAQFEHFLFA